MSRRQDSGSSRRTTAWGAGHGGMGASRWRTRSISTRWRLDRIVRRGPTTTSATACVARRRPTRRSPTPIRLTKLDPRFAWACHDRHVARRLAGSEGPIVDCRRELGVEGKDSRAKLAIPTGFFEARTARGESVATRCSWRIRGPKRPIRPNGPTRSCGFFAGRAGGEGALEGVQASDTVEDMVEGGDGGSRSSRGRATARGALRVSEPPFRRRRPD